MLFVLVMVGLLPRIIAGQDTFVVAAVFSHKSSHVEDFLKTAEREIRDTFPDETTLYVRSHSLQNQSEDFYSSLLSFHDVINGGNISMVIILEDMGGLSQMITQLCSTWRVPVSLTYETLSVGRKVT